MDQVVWGGADDVPVYRMPCPDVVVVQCNNTPVVPGPNTIGVVSTMGTHTNEPPRTALTVCVSVQPAFEPVNPT